jgi:small subunit ribosomal protein S15
MLETNKKTKSEIIQQFARIESDTGSSEVQVALLTHHINSLNDHFKSFSKDYQAQRGLIKLVGQRRKLLAYLKKKDAARYFSVIQKLNLRK